MHHFQLGILAHLLLFWRGALATEFAQLAIRWCLDHPHAEGGYAQCVGKVVCQEPGQSKGSVDGPSATCVSYGKCDCSRTQPDSEEYFECIAKSDCAACTTVLQTTTWTAVTSSYDGLETLTPGTYTLADDGTTQTAVVPLPTATMTVMMTVTESLAMTTTTTTTKTTTTTITWNPSGSKTTATNLLGTSTETTGSTTTPTPTPIQTAPPICPSMCQCEPSYGSPQEYQSCLGQPECAGCRMPYPPLPNATPDETATAPWENWNTTMTSSWSTTTLARNSTMSSGLSPASPSCGSTCDCSKIKNKTSEEYFQCITNPNCERCSTGEGSVGGRR